MHRLHNRFWPRAVLAGCACLSLLVLACRVSAEADTSDSPLEPELTGRPGILVMRNGRVVDGRILKSGEDFTVQSPSGGIMFVPGSLVSMHCENLRGAYRKLRDNAQKEASPAAHCALARWCIANKLTDEARAELNAALQLDPMHDETRNLLSRLNEVLDPERPDPAKNASASPVAPRMAARFAADEVESLGRLSRDHAQQFTRRIQPILVNNCALAGCHSAESETGFRLQRVVPGGDTSRNASERNLAEVLEQVDWKSPRASPLLTEPRGNHGRRGRRAFPGPRGADQYEEIRRWVRSVARVEAAREKREGTAPEPDGRIEQASGIADRDESDVLPRGATRRAVGDAPRKKQAFSVPDPFQLLRDPFDPELFNSSTAGNTRR